MSVDSTNTMKKRELSTLKRIELVQRSSSLLMCFFNKGFRSFDAFKAVIQNYYPEIPESKVFDFWHFRNVSEEVCDKIELVLELLINQS
ncbi:hypothetical protein JJC03_13165 [Flavobacterium oreochromis]|uniref:Uncharacterized protein n=2 Tax=Flavobacterium TaxID=237 RepID=A0A2D0AHP6_9FLAO|nr:hypothetical protein [Flavobacterium oreochromis]OWP76070.1 hypothetical protein BWK62_10445 [Flavobacterium oreochromis]OWP76681.1 hypothetical protein BWG23_07140 [Flavobacterium oreochromis]POR22585.1 hypothetical protein BWK58_10880 [Flavobacterium columnare]QYS85975.1 hypothetical protein JJC03_13165 [Flavobacterium oreochromis]